ncbi:MAG TPA: hypothetical protein VG867_05205 [Rhizomicrobium sp.]|nr:hypothetical protein [Rhizomicrobium sp.]
MRSSFVALALAGAFFATAAYADDPMANTYGNTVTTKSEKTGATGKLMFNQDGTYSAQAMGADGKPVAYNGKWTLKDGDATICLAPELPPNSPGAAPSCSPLQKHNVGDSWTTTNDQGETFDVSIVAGR